MPEWQLAKAFDFDSPEALDEWFLEGGADVSVATGQELLIDNAKKIIDGQEVSRSTLWYKEPIWGDLKFDMEVRGEDKNGNIWFFNAQPLKGHKTIFEWARPRANYVDYTRDPRMHMYTLGYLRAHQDELNFRFLGGELLGLF